MRPLNPRVLDNLAGTAFVRFSIPTRGTLERKVVRFLAARWLFLFAPCLRNSLCLSREHRRAGIMFIQEDVTSHDW
jgi:hypothetical protein